MIKVIRRAVGAGLLLSGLLASCGGTEPEEPPLQSSPVVAERCLVRLHGKGGQGAPAAQENGVAIISPEGNANGWGGKQWLYFPDDQLEEAREVVESAVEGCDRIILNGFSNGASFLARLYCAGEDFDGRLESVVIDDPVTDSGSANCDPAPAVAATLYWTGALEGAGQPGANCKDIDWTCEGGTTIGIREYAYRLGLSAKESPLNEHAWYTDAPELSDW